MVIVCGFDSLVYSIYENRIVFFLVVLYVYKEDFNEKINFDNYVLFILVENVVCKSRMR